MNIFKKSTAIFMIMLTLFTMIPVSVLAAGDSYETQTQSKVNYKGTNALGAVLSDAVTEENEEQQNDGYFILDVAVEGQTATVNYSAPDGATLIVAVYNEEGTRMVTSAKAHVDSLSEQTEVTFDAELPEYFLIKAFILDSENAPVCRNFESIKYTEGFQEFLAKETTDFEEEKVINLDESTDNNFAVVSDDAQIVEQTEGENVLTVNDGENGIYTFENAGEEITDLKEGDVFYFVYGEGAEEYILTKVGTIETDGDTVTITAADEYEISDFFSYIKIDTEQAEEEQEDGNLKYGYDEDKGDVDESSAEFKVSVSDEYKGDGYEVGFSGSLSIKFYLQFYYDFKLFKEDYYEITQTSTVSFKGETTIKVQAEKEFQPLMLFQGGVPIIPGVTAEVEFSLIVKVSAELSVTGGIEIKLVNGSRKVSGKADEDLSQKPSVTLSFDAQGKVSLEITPSVSVGFNILYVVEVSVGIEAGLVISGTLHLLEVSSDDSFLYPDEKHSCDKCIDGDVKLKMAGFIKVEFGISEKKRKTVLRIDLFSAETKLFDFYISIDVNVLGTIENIKFGFDECPNIVYKVTYKALDENSNPLENVKIDDGENVLVTDSNGEVFSYYGNGTHVYDATLDGYEVDTNKISTSFAVTGESRNVNVLMKKRSKCKVSGTVTDGETGSPISGVGIDISTSLLEDSYYITTDSNGAFEIELYYGTYNITFSHTDYEEYDDILSLYWEEQSLNIEMTKKTEETTEPEETTDPEGTVPDEELGENDIVDSGECGAYGDEVTWVLYGNGNLVISGSGKMKEYSTSKEIPWSVYKTLIKSVVVEDGVTSIVNYAFNNCDSLKDVEVGNSVTNIGDRVFGDCDDLVSVTLGSSVTKMGEYVFYDCDSITSIIIPDSTIYLGKAVLGSCDSLESVIIGSSVETIPDYMFDYCRKLTNIIIPDSVTSIGVCAFYYCSSLTSVIIGNSVTSIGDYGFGYCSGFKEIVIPDSVISIGKEAFFNCDSLTDVTIGNGVTNIAEKAFCNCEVLTNVLLGNRVTTIGDYAFDYCDKLTSIFIPSSVTSIGFCTFAQCYSLVSITVDENNEYYSSDEYDVLFNKDKSQLIQYPVGNQRTEYVIPDSTKSVEYAAFRRCNSLTKVTMPNSVTNIGDLLFSGCNNLTNITISESITSIGDYTFSGCDNLIDVTIHDGVVNIGKEAFYDCDSIVNITIPDSVTSIGNKIFNSCDNLENVIMGSGITCIDAESFNYCYKLKNITISSNVSSIGDSAFFYCRSLTDVYYTGTEEQWNAISIGSENDYLTSATIHYNYTPEEVAVVYDASPRLSGETSVGLINETTESIPGYNYVIAVIKDSSAEDLLSKDNLLFIDQKEADGDTLSFSFCLDESITDYEVLFFSADLTVDVPDIDEPAEDETTEPTTTEPTTTEPTTTEPTTTEPTTTEPTTTETTTTKPTTKPSTTKPVTTTPSTTAPTVTKPVTPETPEQPTKAEKPAKVKLKSVKSPKKKRIVVTWKKVAGANGYEILYSTSKKFKKKVTKTVTIKKGTKVKSTIKKLRSKKKYFVKVRAYKTVNGTKLYGKWSKVKTVKVK